MLTLAIIPARSGSKGIKDKNIMSIGGQPLISWSIKQAKRAQVDKIVISTDSQEYKQKIDSWFPKEELVPFIRAKGKARDDSPTSSVILDVLDRYPDYEMFVLLEPTSPLRLTADITVPISYIQTGKCKAVVGVYASHRCHPAVSFSLGMKEIGMKDANGLQHCIIPNTLSPRRQALRPVYHQTGTVYAAISEWYREHKTFMTPDTVGYIVQGFQDKEIDEPDDIAAILPFLDRVK